MKVLSCLLVSALLAGCGPSDDKSDSNKNWWEWHAEKQTTDLAISEAVNEPKGGDYAKAVSIARGSNWPEVLKQFEIGMLIIASYDREGSRRPPETIGAGLVMAEQAVLRSGEPGEVGPQQLRLLFERGAGIAPHMIPIDPVVANCWLKLENHGVGDRRKCVLLRKQRHPQLG